jgi:hypothetical protein
MLQAKQYHSLILHDVMCIPFLGTVTSPKNSTIAQRLTFNESTFEKNVLLLSPTLVMA